MKFEMMETGIACLYQFLVGIGDPTHRQRAEVNDLAVDIGSMEFDEAHS
jgi:hypothetical protein